MTSDAAPIWLAFRKSIHGCHRPARVAKTKCRCTSKNLQTRLKQKLRITHTAIMLLADIVTSVQDMLILMPFIVSFYSEDGTNDNMSNPPLFDIADDLNGIMAVLTRQYPLEGIPKPASIRPEEAQEGRDGDEIMEEWVESFVRYLTSNAICQSLKTEAVDAFVSFVARIAVYDTQLSYEENVHDLLWLLKHWRRLHPVSPAAFSEALYEFLSNGDVHWCQGCHQYHLYFDPERRDHRTYVLSLDDGTVFEADEKNICRGQYCASDATYTIMRCSDAHPFSECCNIHLCDRCWQSHYCNRSDSSTCS